MFLSPEEKLLSLRKKYKITQGELVGDDITRVFLGMIEIGKRSLTEKTAKLLCKNFHKILSEQGIKDKISLEELMKTREQQAIEFLNNMLLSEIDISDDNLWIIEEALYELAPKERSEFCEKLYSRFKNRERYLLAKEYLLKSFHGVRKIPNLKDKLKDIFFLCDKVNDPECAVCTYRRFASWLEKEKLNPSTEELKYSYAKALIEMKEYTEALQIAKYLAKKTKNDSTLFIARNLIARIYKEKGMIEDSIKEYTSLAKGRSNQDKCVTYCKVIKIGMELDDMAIIKKYYEKCRDNFGEHAEHNDPKNLSVLFTLARAAKLLGKIKDSKAYYMEALVVGRLLKGMEKERVTIIGELFDVVDKSDFYSVQSIETEYADLLKITGDYKPAIKILNYYQNYLPNDLSKKFELFIK